jgi:glycosyltransferase involved in cell wall biosynthesis
MARALFVLKYRETPKDDQDYGSGWGDGYGKHLHSGLYNSATFVSNMLNTIGIESKLVHVLDNNFIHREVVAYQPTHVFIEAFWVVPAKFDELAKACPGVTFVVRNHSETPFLANEGIAFGWMMEYFKKPNVVMSGNAPRMVEEMRFLLKTQQPNLTPEEIERKVPLLPNFYPIFEDNDKRIDKDSMILNVGCFGSIRPLKNHMAQAIGALKYAEKTGKYLDFHINGSRMEGRGEPILKNLIQTFDQFSGKHRLIRHPWRPHNEFKELIRSMDVVTQVSFTETFNIVSADAITVGVPIVVSPEVPWANPVCFADPTDTNDIAKAIGRVYTLKKWFPKISFSMGGLKKYNKDSIKAWGNYLDDNVV